jgi:hypothetical protein
MTREICPRKDDGWGEEGERGTRRSRPGGLVRSYLQSFVSTPEDCSLGVTKHEQRVLEPKPIPVSARGVRLMKEAEQVAGREAVAGQPEVTS